MGPGEPVIIRRVRPEEYDAVGELVVDAYRTLGDVGDEFYEQQLRDVAGRVASSEVLVAEMAGRLVGSVTFVDGQAALREVDDPDAGTIRIRSCRQVRAATGTARHANVNDKRAAADERLGFRRDPEHDWSPAPRILLLSYVLDLD